MLFFECPALLLPWRRHWEWVPIPITITPTTTIAIKTTGTATQQTANMQRELKLKLHWSVANDWENPAAARKTNFSLHSLLANFAFAYLLHGYICRRLSFVGRLWPWVFNVCNATAAISKLPLRRLPSVPGHCLCLGRRHCHGWLPSFFGCRKFLLLLVEKSEATQDYHEVQQRTVYKFRQTQSRQNAALSAVAASGGAVANASFRGCCFFRLIVFVFCFTP